MIIIKQFIYMSLLFILDFNIVVMMMMMISASFLFFFIFDKDLQQRWLRARQRACLNFIH